MEAERLRNTLKSFITIFETFNECFVLFNDLIIHAKKQFPYYIVFIFFFINKILVFHVRICLIGEYIML